MCDARLLQGRVIERTVPLQQFDQLRQIPTARNQRRGPMVVNLKSGWQDLVQLFL